MTTPTPELERTFAYLYRTYFGEGVKEAEELALLPGLLAGCELFLDVGASLGQYTFFANRILRGKRIVAIEADPDRYAELAKNCAKWEKEGTNRITVIHSAVGDARDPVRFWVTRTQISGGLFPVAERSDLYRPIEVPQVTVDDFYEPGVPTFIKIDVEGGESRVMRGARRHVEGGHTRFLTEITWWGDRERGFSTASFLRALYGQRLRIAKVARRRTSSYLLTPTEPGTSIWRDYLRAAPLLVATSMWGKLVPERLRVLRERRLNRRRLRKHGSG